MGDRGIHLKLLFAWIFQLDVMPPRPAASEVAFSVEYLPVAVAGDGDPGRTAALVGDFLPRSKRDGVDVPLQRRAMRPRLSRGHGRTAVRRSEASRPRFGIGQLLRPSPRDQARTLSLSDGDGLQCDQTDGAESDGAAHHG